MNRRGNSRGKGIKKRGARAIRTPFLLSKPVINADASRRIAAKWVITYEHAEPYAPGLESLPVALCPDSRHQVSQVLQAVFGLGHLDFGRLQENGQFPDPGLVEPVFFQGRLAQGIVNSRRFLRPEQTRPQRRMNPRRYRWDVA